ncbi:MAG TPA: hypothetical protein VGU27_04165, partial [Candidatus Eisenbacteria bacterium]|nr:hypothetical protein [Candidatus Eisenbacteria bacterium]
AAAPLALVAWLAAGDPAAIADRDLYATCLARAHEPLGRELARLPLAHVRLALSDAGAIPYFSDAWTLDLGGLDDRDIARTRDRSPARVFGRGVNALILVSARSARFAPFDWNAYEGRLYAAAVARGWRRVALRRFHAGYWLWVLAPRGSPLTRLAGGP